MKPLFTIVISVLLSSLLSSFFTMHLFEKNIQLARDMNAKLADLAVSQQVLGSTVSSTASSDTINTLRTNVNASLDSLQNDKVSTTTAYTWTALQKLFANASTTGFSANYGQFGGTATTTISSSGTLGIASSSPLGKLGIGTTGATSTISGGFFCSYFKDEAGRGMWIKLATSGSLVFATSTSSCN